MTPNKDDTNVVLEAPADTSVNNEQKFEYPTPPNFTPYDPFTAAAIKKVCEAYQRDAAAKAKQYQQMCECGNDKCDCSGQCGNQSSEPATNTVGSDDAERGDAGCDSVGNNVGCPNEDSWPATYTHFGMLTNALNTLYYRKNQSYGDSFGRSIHKYGPIAALTRMSDKWNRVENIMLGGKNLVGDESLNDTLVDLAAYALMTVCALNSDMTEFDKFIRKLKFGTDSQ